ncbi:hypothetical protein LPJ66_002411 [Kickxella alabastrina]|uniref:Uncharacterized protein n=1 Tax=Kickxella alabastrina TaxID=61397 RepID=A0ACC1IQI5_9FUNG|nr:hypothetical protein LPJ66_002411 [Kickxella alabastrina]
MGNQLSFTLTESELQRQKNAEAMGLKLDPRGMADMSMLIVISMIYSFNFLAVVYMLRNRNYAPIKSKNVIVMALIMAVSVVWFVGDLQSNAHVSVTGTPLTNCKAFGVWMRVIIGAGGMCSLTAFRAYGLYRVFYLHKPFHGLGLYLPFAIYWLCALAVGLTSQFIKPSMTTEYIPELDMCTYRRNFLTSLFTFLWVSGSMVAIAHWMIRNIKSSFNEAHEMMATCAIMFVVLLISTIVNYINPMYLVNYNLRILITSTNHFASNSLWWLIMGKPIYKCMFDQNHYLHMWMHKLRKDGLQKEYEVDTKSLLAEHIVLADSYNKCSRPMSMSAACYTNTDSFYEPGSRICALKHVDPRDTTYANFVLSSKGTSALNVDSANEQATRISIGDGLCQKHIQTGCPDHCIVALDEPQLYAPISIPDAAAMPPLKLSAAHVRHLNYYDPSERQLL